MGRKVTGRSRNKENILITLKCSGSVIVPNEAVHLYKASFHRKIVEEMCDYENVATINCFLTLKSKFEKYFAALDATKLLPLLAWAFLSVYALDTVLVSVLPSFSIDDTVR